MKIHTLNLGELRSNSYVVETAPGRCIIVDLGGDADYLMNFLKINKLKLTKILLTHGHFDHIGGVEEVRRLTGAKVFIHVNDSEMLTSEKSSLASAMSYNPFIPVALWTAVEEDSIIQDGELSFKVIHTPGHSGGSVCYICEDVIFSGDTLFNRSIGRTDFSGGNPIDMKKSLKKLSLLDGDYKVLPGHNTPTTLDFERKMNPYMKNI